ncbi:uncharacterized protein C1orf158 homolog [Amblyraja radiata]|uniref:uncharacterized protein C1orf158 homolog n=1 Tax=Amblyraja radiata TaxID=386614 RepID=UPI001401EC22|nr:uncharacterized protein C1orf158 homolog [Amblyraja radiata]
MTEAENCPGHLADRFAPDPVQSAPGWRIQQHYLNKVLVGNWAEERLKFIKGTCFGTTTYRADYKRYPFVSADVKEKILIQQKHKGVPLSVFFSHHDIPRSWYLVSHYDEAINKRPNPCLPPLRTWDKRNVVWHPERTDYPIIAPPTNFGLVQEKMVKVHDQKLRHHTMYQSVYNISYGPHSIAHLCL